MLFEHFKLEKHPETGRMRVVTYMPDPDTRQPARTDEGRWTDPVDPVAKMAAIERLSAERLPARGAAPAPSPPNKPHDPEGWL